MHVRNQEKVIILSYSWLKEAVLEEAGKGRGEEKEEDKNMYHKKRTRSPLSQLRSRLLTRKRARKHIPTGLSSEQLIFTTLGGFHIWRLRNFRIFF